MKLYLTFFPCIILVTSILGQSLSYDSLSINNINARFYSGGQMFQDIANGVPAYEITQGSGQHTIFAGNLWMGGLDNNNNLKMAAQTYTTGDFFYGPAAYNVSTGNQPGYDYVWKISKQEIDDFIAWYQCSNTAGCTPNPSYVIPSIILNWPAHGDVSIGQNFNLAPFVDTDQNGYYDPNQGDYPCIKGDMALFQIYNDIGSHSATNSDFIGAEIKVMHYAYDHDPTFLGNDESFTNTIFSEYAVTNTSNDELHDFSIGIWEDMDIGCTQDDYVGCNVEKGLVYTYNGTSHDSLGCTGGSLSFDTNTPAQGMVVLKGLRQQFDGVDNPLTTDVPLAINQEGIPYEGLGCGYSDNITDNEYRGLSKFMSFHSNLDPMIFGLPVTAAEYYNFMNSKWRDGTDLVHGGTGHPSSGGASSASANYTYTGVSDPLFWSTGGVTASPSNWSEGANANVVGDRKSLAMIGPINFEVAETYTFTIAHITGMNPGTTGNGVDELFQSTDDVRTFYSCAPNVFDGYCDNSIATNVNSVEMESVTLFPNPTTGNFYIKSENQIVNVSIYNVSGQKVYESDSAHSKRIDLTSCEPGIYFVHLTIGEKEHVVKKIVKN